MHSKQRSQEKAEQGVPIDGFHMPIMVVAPLLPSSFNCTTSFHTEESIYVKERKKEKRRKEKDVRAMSSPPISSEAKSFPTFKFIKSVLLDPPQYHTPHHKHYPYQLFYHSFDCSLSYSTNL